MSDAIPFSPVYRPALLHPVGAPPAAEVAPAGGLAPEAEVAPGTPELAELDALADLDALARDLDGVDFALRRLDDGGYGTCEACGTTISGDVLEAFPAARRCAGHGGPAVSSGAGVTGVTGVTG